MEPLQPPLSEVEMWFYVYFFCLSFIIFTFFYLIFLPFFPFFLVFFFFLCFCFYLFYLPELRCARWMNTCSCSPLVFLFLSKPIHFHLIDMLMGGRKRI